MFDPAILTTLRNDKEVRIRTGGQTKGVIIWIVVAGYDVFVRSVRGPKGKWNVAASADGEATLEVAGRQVPTKRYQLYWSALELYEPHSAEELAQMRESREQRKAARERKRWTEENPLFDWLSGVACASGFCQLVVPSLFCGRVTVSMAKTGRENSSSAAPAMSAAAAVVMTSIRTLFPCVMVHLLKCTHLGRAIGCARGSSSFRRPRAGPEEVRVARRRRHEGEAYRQTARYGNELARR